MNEDASSTPSFPSPSGMVIRKNTTEAALVAMAARVGSVGWKCRSKTAYGSGCLWRRVLCRSVSIIRFLYICAGGFGGTVGW